MLEDYKFTMHNAFYKESQSNSLKLCSSDDDDGKIIEDSYNFRTENPDCAAPIYNQGNCSSNYAVIAASTIADRLCLNSAENERPKL